MRWTDPAVAALGFVVAFGAVRTLASPPPPPPVEPVACPPIEVPGPCDVVGDPAPPRAERLPEPPQPEALDEPPDVEEGRVAKAELLDCLGPGATAWLDCAEAPCLVAGVARVEVGYTRCFPGMVRWRTVSAPDGDRVNVGVTILGEDGIRPFARRARIFDELIEHVESGALEVD